MGAGPKVCVYMACSLDGFIAGRDGDLSWLHAPREVAGDVPADGGALEFGSFMATVGCLLMGRRTYDTVESFGQWPYGETPVHVATHRPLIPMAPSVRPVQGEVTTLLDEALATAAGRDVYLDGGDLVRQALNAGRVDEITATFVPVLLGQGTRLFEELAGQSRLQFTASHPMAGGMWQLRARVLRGP